MPWWWPRKVDCTDGSTAIDVAMALVCHFGHVDVVERIDVYALLFL
jgi:hypothetical protein